jgi:hypothetical protein
MSMSVEYTISWLSRSSTLVQPDRKALSMRPRRRSVTKLEAVIATDMKKITLKIEKKKVRDN